MLSEWSFQGRKITREKWKEYISKFFLSLLHNFQWNFLHLKNELTVLQGWLAQIFVSNGVQNKPDLSLYFSLVPCLEPILRVRNLSATCTQNSNCISSVTIQFPYYYLSWAEFCSQIYFRLLSDNYTSNNSSTSEVPSYGFCWSQRTKLPQKGNLEMGNIC